MSSWSVFSQGRPRKQMKSEWRTYRGWRMEGSGLRILLWTKVLAIPVRWKALRTLKPKQAQLSLRKATKEFKLNRARNPFVHRVFRAKVMSRYTPYMLIETESNNVVFFDSLLTPSDHTVKLLDRTTNVCATANLPLLSFNHNPLFNVKWTGCKIRCQCRMHTPVQGDSTPLGSSPTPRTDNITIPRLQNWAGDSRMCRLDNIPC